MLLKLTMKDISNQSTKTGLSWFTLFVTSGTLICCALPILLVTLGLGASIAAITSSFPLLITLSQHKLWIFIISGSLLIGSAWMILRNKGQCPANTELGELCQRAKLINRRIWFISVFIWIVGFIAAYLALPIQQWLEL